MLSLIHILTLLGLTVVSGAPLPSFDSWAIAHGREYASPNERAMRNTIFNDNMILASKHNALELSTFTMGATIFADLTLAEFTATFLFNSTASASSHSKFNAAEVNSTYSASETTTYPASKNWIPSGCTTSVLNQGQCGSEWAIVATEVLEWTCCLSKSAKSLVSLSVQEVVDCSSSQGGQGCSGGLITSGWKYAIDAGGLCTESAYPYAQKDGKCEAKLCPHQCRPTSIVNVAANNANATLNAISGQPIAVLVQGSSTAFQMYTSGVISGPACGTMIDHSLAVTGYDSTASTPFITAMNSWGEAWGENGFVRIALDPSANGGMGTCGIYESPAYVIVK
jgi:KDEL-tailed cysteine endopeptidase